MYYDVILKSGWKGKVEFYELEGEDYVFYIFDFDCDEVVELRRKLVFFIK